MQVECPVCRFLNACRNSDLVLRLDCESCHSTLIAIGYQEAVLVRRLDDLSASTQQLLHEHLASTKRDSVSMVELVMIMEDDSGDADGDDSAAAVRR